MSSARATSLIALLALLAPAAGAVDDTPRESLEKFLRRARAAREALRQDLEMEVQALIDELEALGRRTKNTREREAERRRKALIALGSEAAPLLLGALDPGPKGNSAAAFRARQVVEVLRALPTPAVTDRLIELTGEGSIEGRMNALKVLETCAEPERAEPAICDLYPLTTGRLRRGVLSTGARLGGPRSRQIRAQALQDPDDDLVQMAIRALGEVHTEGVAGEVLELVRSLRAQKYIAALIGFYGDQRELLEYQEHLQALVELAGRSRTPRADGVALIEALTELEVEPRSATRKAMKVLVEHPNLSLREAALVLLARAGDKGARRDLMRRYNDTVAAQRAYHQAYSERGDVYYRIGEYTNAIRDFKDAIELQRTRTKEAEPYVGLARCYARTGKFKEAKKYIDSAPLSVTSIQKLAEDPAFAEMLESKYRSAFMLEE